jgi:hypothetical protein
VVFGVDEARLEEGGGHGATCAEEEVTVGCVRLLLAHGDAGHVPPGTLRAFLCAALRRFPARWPTEGCP